MTTKLQFATDFMPKDKKSLKILHERAVNFSKLSENKIISSEEKDYIQFLLGEKNRYGIPFSYAKEVVRYAKITHLPNSNPVVMGITNWRGILLTVLDLKKYFYINDASESHSEMIVVQHNKVFAGILVEKIIGSDNYVNAHLSTSLSSKNGVDSDYILGLHEGEVAILNVPSILTDIQAKLSKN